MLNPRSISPLCYILIHRLSFLSYLTGNDDRDVIDTSMLEKFRLYGRICILDERKDGFQSVSCGDNHTAALTFDGCVYRWGCVNGRTVSKPAINAALLPYQVSMVSCGPTVTCSLVAAPSLYLKVRYHKYCQFVLYRLASLFVVRFLVVASS